MNLPYVLAEYVQKAETLYAALVAVQNIKI